MVIEDTQLALTRQYTEEHLMKVFQTCRRQPESFITQTAQKSARLLQQLTKNGTCFKGQIN